MRSDPGARQAIRAATSAHHERVDAAYAVFDLTCRLGYAAFLQAQAAAFLPTEAAIDAVCPEGVLDDWPDRRRSCQVMADLAALGMPAPAMMERPVLDTADAALGAIYVLEGSRLGGRMLARSVRQDLPRSFLNAGDAGLWRKLVGVLDARLVSDRQLAAAAAAAREVFALFETSARHHREVLS